MSKLFLLLLLHAGKSEGVKEKKKRKKTKSNTINGPYPSKIYVLGVSTR